MAGVCFFFENKDVDVWSGKNLDAWHYSFAAAGDIDNILIINRTVKELNNPDPNRYNFNIVTTIPELNGYSVGVQTPWRAGETAISLWDFDHKNVDWYCFGSAAGELPNCDKQIFIPQHGTGALHSVHISSVVMMHRYGKILWQ